MSLPLRKPRRPWATRTTHTCDWCDQLATQRLLPSEHDPYGTSASDVLAASRQQRLLQARCSCDEHSKAMAGHLRLRFGICDVEPIRLTWPHWLTDWARLVRWRR